MSSRPSALLFLSLSLGAFELGLGLPLPPSNSFMFMLLLPAGVADASVLLFLRKISADDVVCCACRSACVLVCLPACLHFCLLAMCRSWCFTGVWIYQALSDCSSRRNQYQNTTRQPSRPVLKISSAFSFRKGPLSCNTCQVQLQRIEFQQRN